MPALMSVIVRAVFRSTHCQEFQLPRLADGRPQTPVAVECVAETQRDGRTA